MWISPFKDTSMEILFHELIHECKHGAPGGRLSYSLRSRLEKYKKDVRKYIVSCTKDGCAPLFIACKRGNVEIVDYLVTECSADVEQRGRYEVPDDKSVHLVTPLWCAAVSGKMSIIQCLLSHGADINAVSDSGSTPVRSACFMTHMEVVSYLVRKGADILKANYNGGTCLINSVQSVELCTFLLQNGADVNATDIQNKTALHYAIQEHRLQTTKLLLEYDADPHIKSRYNDDALQTACLKGAVHIFEYLLDKISYPMEKVADAYELMGSTFFDDHNDTHTALRYWRIAMAIRMSNLVDGEPMSKKPSLLKCEAYRNATEFATVEELNAVALDVDAIRIQSLLICERILGPHHKDTLFRLMFRGASYADAFRYQRCIELWHRALEIRVKKDSILYTDTCFAAQVLLRLMVDLNEKTLEVMDNDQDTQEPRFCDVVSIFKLLSGQLMEASELLEKRPVYKKQKDCYERIMRCVTHLIYLLVETARSDDEKDLMRELVRDLVKQNPRSAYMGDTLLHLCVSSLNTVNSNYFNPADSVHAVFPHLDVVKLLLECGAYVDAKNIVRSTPLHIASGAYNFDNSLIKLLLDYGAHLDVPNNTGELPVRLISNNPLNRVNLVKYISLQCHAAQAICKYGIRSTDIPVTVRHFLELHRERH